MQYQFLFQTLDLKIDNILHSLHLLFVISSIVYIHLKKAKKSPTTHNLNRLAIAEQDFKDYIDKSKISLTYEKNLFITLLIIQITKSTNASGIFLRVKTSPPQCFMMTLVLTVTKLRQIFSMNIFTQYLPHPLAHYLRFGNSQLILTQCIQFT